jgi:hypothetical protein
MRPHRFSEQVGNVASRLMNRGGDYVRGALARQLNYVFAEVGLDRFNPCGSKSAVQLDLFGHHRLAFDGEAHATLAREIGYVRVSFRGISRPEYMPAQPLDV